MNSWPHADHPGFPINPDIPGAHELKNLEDVSEIWLWDPDLSFWSHSNHQMRSPELQFKVTKYMGPCVTHTDHRDMAEAAIRQFKDNFLDEVTHQLRDRSTPGNVKPGLHQASQLLINYRKNYVDRNIYLRDDIREILGWTRAIKLLINLIDDPEKVKFLMRRLEQINMIRSRLIKEHSRVKSWHK